MRPYYEQDGIVIYHADCRDVFPSLQLLDVVITDPPYGISLVTKTSDYRDSSFFDSGESLRASVLYADGADDIRQLIGDVMPLAQHISQRMMVFCGPNMLWSYPEPRAVGCVFTLAGAGRCAWGFQCCHPVLFYGKDPYLADGLGGRPNSFRDDQPNIERIDHPCPKPERWMRWAVNRASRGGETILDPFMGSGTTLVAAKRLGRKAIGIEIEERYCEIAAQRLAQGALDLFGEATA